MMSVQFCKMNSSIICQFLVIFPILIGGCSSTCQTPLDAQGECKPIYECNALLSILNRKPVSSFNVDLLKRSQCGLENNIPKVCCPLRIRTTTPKLLGEYTLENPLLPSRDICGVDIQNKITGGTKTDITEFPWMAMLKYQKGNNTSLFLCGGVLINSRYVLTAAHCLRGKYIYKRHKLIAVRLGEYDTKTDEDCTETLGVKTCAFPHLDIAIEEKIVHEHYSPHDDNQYHDVALLRLAEEIKYTNYVKPICLPDYRQFDDLTGKKLAVVGWGVTETNMTSTVKRKVFVPVKSNEECAPIYRDANVELSDDQMCAGGEKGKDSCRGDSGGPLMGWFADNLAEINWYSIGIVSIGHNDCGTENFPAVYTKVSNYVPWIMSKIRR